MEKEWPNCGSIVVSEGCVHYETFDVATYAGTLCILLALRIARAGQERVLLGSWRYSVKVLPSLSFKSQYLSMIPFEAEPLKTVIWLHAGLYTRIS